MASRPRVCNGRLDAHIDIRRGSATLDGYEAFPGWLSQRQWDSVTRQAKGALDSWVELRETEFRRVVNGSSLSSDMKRELYDINRRHEWWKPEDDEAHRMARRIIKHLRKQVPFPAWDVAGR